MFIRIKKTPVMSISNRSGVCPFCEEAAKLQKNRFTAEFTEFAEKMPCAHKALRDLCGEVLCISGSGNPALAGYPRGGKKQMTKFRS
jgi:hypothetical protein